MDDNVDELVTAVSERLDMTACDEFMQLARFKFDSPMTAAMNFAFLSGACTVAVEGPEPEIDKEALALTFKMLFDTGADMMRLAKEKMDG